MKTKSRLGPSVALFLCTAVWGLFWLPLRHIERSGITSEWAVFAVNFIPLLCLVPVIFYGRNALSKNLKTKCFIGIAMGGGMALWAIAILYTTVLKATLLFYMSPIWATLLSMALLKENISITRWIAIAVGFAGILLLLSGNDTGQVFASLSRGDFLALLSGFMWGYGTVLVRGNSEIPAIDIVPWQYFWATAVSLFMVFISSAPPMPALDQWLDALPVIVGFYSIIIVPTIFITTRCAQLLSPGRVCLLMMSEVMVAGISAPLLAGESVNTMEWMAGALILSATLIEVYSTPEEEFQTNG